MSSPSKTFWVTGPSVTIAGGTGLTVFISRSHSSIRSEGADAGGQTQADGQARSLTLGVGEHPVPSRIARNLVEEDCRCTIGVDEHLGDAADVLLPVDALHDAQLAERVD